MNQYCGADGMGRWRDGGEGSGFSARIRSGCRKGKEVMGPMMGISGSGVGAAPSLRNGGEIGTGTAQRGGGTEYVARANGSSQTITRISSSVTQLLQSVGGGLENDKLLRLLIALLVLMAMLDNLKEGGQRATSALPELGSRGYSGGGFIASYSSSVTTVSVQQTYATAMPSEYAGASGGSSQGTGTELDTVA